MTPPSLPAGAADLPLVVDLDGTLIRSDLLVESAVGLLRQAPLQVFSLPVWLLNGKAHLKAALAERVALDATVLPYHPELLGWLRAEKQRGRRLILATASHQRYAEAVAAHLQLFDEVWASDGDTNLAGRHKAARAVAAFGERGFVYAGNAEPDLAVWAQAAAAVVVSDSARLQAAAAQRAPLERAFPGGTGGLMPWLKALRLHQWMKNLLVLIPLLAAHRFTDIAGWLASGTAFLAFGLTASSVYLLNDLLDVEDDRHHRSKSRRPFAAGTLPMLHGLLAVPLLLGGAALLAASLPPRFGLALGSYFGLTLAYSLWLKRQMMVDVMALAVLYTLRIIGGTFAVGLALSFWLLAFSMFMFLSLALLKRYSELIALRQAGDLQGARGRDYQVEDIELLAGLGSAAGYCAVLVLALYVNNPPAEGLHYSQPKLIWLMCPVLLYWISRAWILAHRGQMHDDPVVFALRDTPSRWLLLLIVFVFGLAL